MTDCGYCHGDHEYWMHCPECMELECLDPDACLEGIEQSILSLERNLRRIKEDLMNEQENERIDRGHWVSGVCIRTGEVVEGTLLGDMPEPNLRVIFNDRGGFFVHVSSLRRATVPVEKDM